LAELQEEILWLCEAALLPVVWATQVLEQLAKSGLPSRAEISDAPMSERAECVMLNKGPYINDAVVAIDNILARITLYCGPYTPGAPTGQYNRCVPEATCSAPAVRRVSQ
jgi:hypothetical protein